MIRNRRNKQKKLMDERIQKVNHAINKYKTSPDAEMELLDSFSRYPGYSIRNIILAEAQNKGSFGLASLKDFQEMGYSVQKGEEAITIAVSHVEKIFTDVAGEEKLIQHANQQEKQAIIEDRIQTQSIITHFQSIPVYDITQTNCPPEDFQKIYPEVPVNFDFDKSDEDYELLEKTLYEYTNEQDLYNQLPLKERIELLVHELARAEMENYQQVALKSNSIEKKKLKNNQEAMIIYLVSKSLGMDKEDYTQRYLMSWQPKEITDEIYIQLLEEVKEISLSLIDALVKNFNQLKKEALNE